MKTLQTITIEKAKRVAKNHEGIEWGIRFDRREVEFEGTELDVSERTENGEGTGEYLNGTSAVDITRFNDSHVTEYGHLGNCYLVMGFSAERGEDIDEVVLNRCHVVARIK